MCSSTKMSGFLPTRLVDVGDQDCHNPKLRIFNPRTDVRPEYITLSHCWGGNVPYTLSSGTIDELQRHIPMSKISQNFRDAIFTCRRLSKRYIWIDSLCIIQDSISDWEEQSALMDLIYANSWCTIAAICAEESTQGFFRIRNPLVVHPCRLPSKVPVSVALNVDFCYSRPYLIAPRPLYKRAWAFQERFLSSRVLQFGEKQLSWECQEMVASEVDPDGSNLRQHPVEDTERDDQTIRESLRRLRTHYTYVNRTYQDDFLASWRVILRTYTSMKLTYPSDRLAAIFGFVQAQQRVTRFSYFEGLWLERFTPMLLWHSSQPARRIAASIEHRGEDLIFSLSSPASTLSWASIEGQIDYHYIWPYCREGDLQIAAFNKMPNAKSSIKLERVHKFTVQKCSSGVATKWGRATISNFDGGKPLPAPYTYHYCTELKAITPSIPLLKQPPIVRLQGPICRFRTELASSDSGSPSWSHPFQDIHMHPKSWFYPDLDYLVMCPEGARLNVACLLIIKWHWNEHAVHVHGQFRAWAAGIVLVECSSRDVPGQMLGERMYCRVGYFEFGFTSPDFEPLWKLTREETVAIL